MANEEELLPRLGTGKLQTLAGKLCGEMFVNMARQRSYAFIPSVEKEGNAPCLLIPFTLNAPCLLIPFTLMDQPGQMGRASRGGI